jgi:hypothetical protein
VGQLGRPLLGISTVAVYEDHGESAGSAVVDIERAGWSGYAVGGGRGRLRRFVLFLFATPCQGKGECKREEKLKGRPGDPDNGHRVVSFVWETRGDFDKTREPLKQLRDFRLHDLAHRIARKRRHAT